MIAAAPLENNNQTENKSDIHRPSLKVIGLGGGGGNAVDRMIELGLNGIEFIVANTDRQVLERSNAPTKIQLGPVSTRGLGAGGNPSVGHKAAKESWREIADALAGADMVFLTAGMGGGTGTGAIPIAARIAKEIGAVAISVVTTPFSFEMGRRQNNAVEGLNLLRQHSDTLISIPNDRLLKIAPKDLPLETAFRLADDVLRQAVQSITELITEPGLINVDFAHIRRMMELGGGALMTIGQAEGPEKALKAVHQALHHPLLEDISIQNAAGIIANFTAGSDLTLMEVSSALNYLHEKMNSDSEIIMGTTVNDQMQDRAQVILVVTGLGATNIEDILPGSERKLSQPVPQRPQPAPQTVEAADNPPIVRIPQVARDTNLDVPAYLRQQPRYINQ